MITGPPDVDQRLAQNEWLWIQRKYPTVAFNSITKGAHQHLVTCEPQTAMPLQWTQEYAKQFDTYITFNPTIYAWWKSQLRCRLISGVPAFNGYYWLDSFVPYEQKIDAIVIQNKLYGMQSEGTILHLRQEAAKILPELGMLVHVWSTMNWGGSCYKGSVGSPLHHSHITQLQKTAEYKFCFCPESTYHPIWSSGFVTERMFNCFKAKTILIYIGCYDIEKYVPKELFVDFRDFYPNNWGGLVAKLKSYSQDQYAHQVEAAFEWQKKNRIGSIIDLEIILKEVI